MTISTLVDTNVFIDALGPDTLQRQWSLKALESCFKRGALVLSAVVWSELAASPLSERELLDALDWLGLKRESLPFEAAFMAGKAHRHYRRLGGLRERTLPDFLIGGHASWRGHALLTRDALRYRSYFPMVELIAPETHF